MELKLPYLILCKIEPCGFIRNLVSSEEAVISFNIKSAPIWS